MPSSRTELGHPGAGGSVGIKEKLDHIYCKIPFTTKLVRWTRPDQNSGLT
jgi:hypothetical protein